MKKLLLSFIFFCLSFSISSACEPYNPIEADFRIQISQTSNIRSYPCTEQSRVLRTVKRWEVYAVIATSWSWYKIGFTDGNAGWIWNKLAQETEEEVKLPHTDISSYQLTEKEILLAKKIVNKIEYSINKKWIAEKDRYIEKLTTLRQKFEIWSRKYVLVNYIYQEIQKVQFHSVAQDELSEKDIDIHALKEHWLSLHNTARNDLWLASYIYDTKLNSTAFEWSSESKQRGSMTHERRPWDGYYNYPIIQEWFRQRWVECVARGWVTASESIAKFSYRCSDGNCTEEVKNSLNDVFDMYMSEKGLQYPQNAHYRAITHTAFTKMWMWISIEHTGNNRYEYYLTTHYCTDYK